LFLLKPIKNFSLSFDSRFHTEHLQEMLREKESYVSVGGCQQRNHCNPAGQTSRNCSTIAFRCYGLKPRQVEQSARRYERLRDMQLNEYFTRVGVHANESFLAIDNLKGIILGGPGPTKYDFEKGGYLNYQLKR